MPWNIIGNTRAVNAVARALASENPPHAYLFTGPERVGKATLALRLAQALNCERNAPSSLLPSSSFPLPPSSDRDPAPCLQCTACTRIANGIHADVQVISIQPNAEGEQKTGIVVEQVRDVEAGASLNPYEGRTRVYIFDPADQLTVEAQNAFLKTLEEPPPHVVLILIATREERLLPTIHSRCRRVEFRLMPSPDIEADLAAEGLDPERASLIARLARGRAGWALSMARDPTAIERRHEVLLRAHAVPRMSVDERMGLGEKMHNDFRANRDVVYDVLAEWAGWWRDVMLIQSGAEEGVANLDLLDELREDSSVYSREEVLAFVRAIIAARDHLRANVQPRPALQLLVLEAPAPSSGIRL